MLPVESLRSLLRAAFPDGKIDIVDLTGTSDHYEVTLVSEAFRGLRRIDQHKLVYGALGDKVGAEIHALALKTRLPG